MIGGIAAWLLDIVFPKNCLQCGREGSYHCDDCASITPLPYALGCFGCRASGNGEICLACHGRYAFDGVIIAADYETEIVATLLRTLKYRFVAEVGEYAAAFLIRRLEAYLHMSKAADFFSSHFFEAVIIPMPLSRRRLRWRGFNQSALIASRVADYFALELSSAGIARRHRRPQAELNEEMRLRNLDGAFIIQGKVPARVVLVDDVITTGATASECAKALKAAGAEEVWVLAVAKG